MKTNKIKEMTKKVTKRLAALLTAAVMLIAAVPTPAAIMNNFVITDEGVMSSWSREDAVVGNWECPAAGSIMTIDEDGDFVVSSVSTGYSCGKWILDDEFLNLKEDSGDKKMFAISGDKLEEIGGDNMVFFNKNELKKPSTATKRVSVSKYAGYWKASEVTSTDALRFTKMFVYVSKKGNMNIYLQQNFGKTKRVAKAVKLNLSKKKDSVSFKTRINGKVVKGSAYIDRGTVYAVVDYGYGKTAIRLLKSSKGALLAATTK